MSGVKLAYVAEGIEFVGTLFTPAGDGPASGVLVAHESPGVTRHTLDAARRLAELGFVALATDYQGGGQVVTDREEMMRRYGVFITEPEHIRARMGAALGALRAQPRVDPGRLAAIGYCYGGTAALELARAGADIKVAAGFHSGLQTARPGDASQIRAKVLVQIGTEDPAVPADQRAAFEAEMRDGAVADWRMVLYGGTGHSFTNPEADTWGMPGFAYHADSDRRSWAVLVDLLNEAGLL